jgi:CRISPR-associated endonuclease/helicase Cas3
MGGGIVHVIKKQALVDIVYAHSLAGKSCEQWEPLSHHLAAVGERAGQFAASFGWTAMARVAGQLHDIGKLSAAFQAYIHNERPSGGDHSSAGACVALERYPGLGGKLLAAIIAAHHAGLADGVDLTRRLDAFKLKVPQSWEAHAGELAAEEALKPAVPFTEQGAPGFSKSFLFRMLFSCLVDADFLETERFYAKAKGEPIERGGHVDLTILRDRLRRFMAEMRSDATPLNRLRRDILDYAIGRAEQSPGLFTLTVPTGGGKTLASLSFALDHAVSHGLRRVIYVIPFTSIIEQTAQVFREALGADDDILEHHASFDWEEAAKTRNPDDEGPSGLRKLQRAAENWDVPIVVTTAVQFFESLFADRPSRCRKLHNIAGSVVILDEVQTLPVHLLRPAMAALDELATNYRSSIVLCTATQPALRLMDKALPLLPDKKPIGFNIGAERELAPDPLAIYQALRRVRIDRIAEKIPDAAVAARFAEQPQMLCIVNSRRHARDLFAAIRDQLGAVHLSTLMCPRHRRRVLAKLRKRLKAQEPVRLVATSLIEAGVDIDFPEVWRAVAGLDSIAQAAGRCNREGSLPALGRVVVFEPASPDAKAPHELAIRWQAARPSLAKHEDPLGLAAITDFYRELYWTKGPEALDDAKVGDYRGILAAIGEQKSSFAFPFKSIAYGFRLIDDIMDPVVVPWRAGQNDDEADKLLSRIAAQDRPSRNDLRQLQQYLVPIPRRTRETWLAAGILKPVHPQLGEAILRLDSIDRYDAKTGLCLDEVERTADQNVIS